MFVFELEDFYCFCVSQFQVDRLNAPLSFHFGHAFLSCASEDR